LCGGISVRPLRADTRAVTLLRDFTGSGITSFVMFAYVVMVSLRLLIAFDLCCWPSSLLSQSLRLRPRRA
jgi:hypothetical protein